MGLRRPRPRTPVCGGPQLNTIPELELQLLDVVLRHEVPGVRLDVDDFTNAYARQVWAAVLDLYARNERPTVLRVHVQMLRRGHHRDDRDAVRLMALPLGHLADLIDLVAIVNENGRRFRIQLEQAS